MGLSRHRLGIIIHGVVLIPSLMLVGATGMIFSTGPPDVLALISLLLFLVQSLALLWFDNPPGEQLWRPPRKLLRPLAWVSGVVGAVFLLALPRIGLFVFYATATLLGGEAIVCVIEAVRRHETPIRIVHGTAFGVLLLANAMFVFETDASSLSFAGAVAFAGAVTMLAGDILEFVAFVARSSNVQMAPEVITASSFDAEADMDSF